MGFAEDIERRTLPLRRAILTHPFLQGVSNGSLPLEKFRYYVSQDYVYLIDYSRVLALAAARAPDLDTMSWFARLLGETVNSEMELHRSYCAELGISRQQLEATEPAPTTIAYTSYLLKVGHQGGFAELVASLLPCQWGYWEIGDYLTRLGEPREAPLYCRWIQMYASPEFKSLALAIRSLADRIGARASADGLAAMGEAYLTSLRFEHRFWEMAFTMEGWAA